MHRHRSPSPQRFATPRSRVLCAALLCALGLQPSPRGCGGSELDPIRTYVPVLELLARPDLRRVVLEDPSEPVRQDLIRPRAAGSDHFGAYPALALRPPAEVTYALPKSVPGAVLRFALAIERGGYAGRGEARFELELDGRPLLDQRLRCDAELPAEERRWHLFERPVSAGGLLRIRCTYEGDQPRPPAVALGLLRVVVPVEVERRPARAGEPNAVLVVIDTLRADRLGAYGNARPVSPAMDALAARGTRYERAYASTPWTVPSTASVLSGLDPIEHGLGFGDSYYLADSIRTLPERFQSAGFTTGGFACNPLISPSRNFDQGFETFVGYPWSRAAGVLDDVSKWLRANRGRRFFLYVHLVDPHYPYQPTPESAAGIVTEPPPGYIEEQLDRHLPAFYADPTADPAPLLASREHQLALYDAEILDADRAIGRLVDLLRELELEENTLVAVTSDHGEEFLEHGWAGHHNQLFDESVRVPLILAGPGVPRGVVAAPPVENRFIGPTLLDLAGLEGPSERTDRSLARARDLRALASEPIFSTNSHGRWASFERREMRKLGQLHGVLHEGWRLIWSPASPRGSELLALFDLADDPDCRRDRSAQQPERAERMRLMIERWTRDGGARRPSLVSATAATETLLRQIGYLGED